MNTLLLGIAWAIGAGTGWLIRPITPTSSSSSVSQKELVQANNDLVARLAALDDDALEQFFASVEQDAEPEVLPLLQRENESLRQQIIAYRKEHQHE